MVAIYGTLDIFVRGHFSPKRNKAGARYGYIYSIMHLMDIHYGY